MTPLEMHFQLHLAQAIIFAETDWAIAKEHLDAAKALITEAGKPEEPPPPVVWCLRKTEETHRRYYGTDPADSGCYGFFDEHDSRVTRFPDMQTALKHAHLINLWRVLEATQLAPAVKP